MTLRSVGIIRIIHRSPFFRRFSWKSWSLTLRFRSPGSHKYDKNQYQFVACLSYRHRLLDYFFRILRSGVKKWHEEHGLGDAHAPSADEMKWNEMKWNEMKWNETWKRKHEIWKIRYWLNKWTINKKYPQLLRVWNESTLGIASTKGLESVGEHFRPKSMYA